MIMFLATVAVESFIRGAACAIALYCGSKTPVSKMMK